LVLALGCLAFVSGIQYFQEPERVYIPPSPQRDGDPTIGYKYLITGDYLKSGIPYNYFKLVYGKNNSGYLKRDSINTGISYEYTAVKAPNGEIVVAPNCLQCHAQVFENKLYIGLGNSTVDFTGGEKLNPRTAMVAERSKRSAPSFIPKSEESMRQTDWQHCWWRTEIRKLSDGTIVQK